MENIAAFVAIVATVTAALFKLVGIFRDEARTLVRICHHAAHGMGLVLIGYWAGVYWGIPDCLPMALPFGIIGLFVSVVLAVEAICFLLDYKERVRDR